MPRAVIEALLAASMRPGQAAPVFDSRDGIAPLDPHASMRPGQAAPVFSSVFLSLIPFSPGFNEAGAGCPGIRRPRRRNPARNPPASMRPGQAAPVFVGATAQGRGEFAGLQ